MSSSAEQTATTAGSPKWHPLVEDEEPQLAEAEENQQPTFIFINYIILKKLSSKNLAPHRLSSHKILKNG